MKKQKSKSSKNSAASKKARKSLQDKLTIALNGVLAQFGKAKKKTEKLVEKFVKQLSKKVNLTFDANDSIAPFIKEEKAVGAPPKKTLIKEPGKKNNKPNL